MLQKKKNLLEKLVKKDYNNELEAILEKKQFSIEVKNILLSMLYKINISYNDYATVKRNVEDIKLSDRLIQLGYSIKKIKNNEFASFDVSSNVSTNHAPIIKNLSEITIKQGTTTDLKIGVEAWDEEDGDITKDIVFPDIDLKTLTVGRHEVTYEVTDSNNNKTTMNRIINVLPVEYAKEDINKSLEELKDVVKKYDYSKLPNDL